jgi:hypothetical protein
MNAFDYSASPDPIRQDITDAHRRTWDHIAAPGTWLTGADRVAVADETRRARTCAVCAERKNSLSPSAVDGEHDHGGVLARPMVDEIHRVTTDASRLTQAWHQSLLADGLPVEQYVEALGVAVLVISIDEFHHAMGLATEPLPEPQAGEPSRLRPGGVEMQDAWVPMINPKNMDAEDKERLGVPGSRYAAVILALSLVPEQVRAWSDLSGAQYLSLPDMASMESKRAIDRSQIELLAGRVSALNECFY